jgi:hypothetical protein
MTPEECRNKLNEEQVSVSILVRGTELPFEKLQQFLDGDDEALSTQEFSRLCELSDADEIELSHQFELQSKTLDAVGDHLEAASVAFVFESKQGGLDIATGTLVTIGDRLFVATAGHVVYPTRMLQFIGKNFGTFESDMSADGKPTNFRGGCNLTVLGSGYSTRPDVGFFEVELQAAHDLKRSPLTLDRLGKTTLEYGRLAFLFGYPKKYTQIVARQSKTNHVPLCSITYPSALLDPREWPAPDPLQSSYVIQWIASCDTLPTTSFLRQSLAALPALGFLRMSASLYPNRMGRVVGDCGNMKTEKRRCGVHVACN